jgi:hypothetical protein
MHIAELFKSIRLMATLSLIAGSAPVATFGADLKAEAVQQWEEYIKRADRRNADHLAGGRAFLVSDEIAGQSAKLRDGAIVVNPADPHVPLKVPSGLIHDWIGAAFIPNATLREVMAVLRDYDRYRDYYPPHVVESKRIAGAEFEDQFSLLFVNRSLVAKTALDTGYRSVLTRVDDRRCYSIGEATRIREIADYDTPAQHTLPEDQGIGLMWRLHNITRLEERDGGVYMELEAIALSRDIPAALRWVLEPIVRRVSRSSLETSLLQTKGAVRSFALTTAREQRRRRENDGVVR